MVSENAGLGKHVKVRERIMLNFSKQKGYLTKFKLNRSFIYLIIVLSIFWPYFSPTEAGIACLSNPCLFGLCVDDANSSYSCYCTDGYTGTNCQTEWDECWSQPCLNGGDCLDLVASYNCTCPEGFSGPSCEFDRDECMSQPCFNNATCVDGSNGFQCHCLPGYSGSFCEFDISVCNATDSDRCFNGGVCIEGPADKFWCICTPGWGGVLCEEPLDPCLLQPCLHGGLCLSRNLDFICACPFGYTGPRCEQELSLCSHNPCLNGAICVEEDQDSVCYCVPDFHGDLCQFQYDECLLPPTPSCKNGGTCIDGVDGFSCSCPPDLTGKFCECPLGLDCSNHSYHPILPSHLPPTGSEDYPYTTFKMPTTIVSPFTTSSSALEKSTKPILLTTLYELETSTDRVDELSTSSQSSVHYKQTETSAVLPDSTTHSPSEHSQTVETSSESFASTAVSKSTAVLSTESSATGESTLPPEVSTLGTSTLLTSTAVDGAPDVTEYTTGITDKSTQTSDSSLVTSTNEIEPRTFDTTSVDRATSFHVTTDAGSAATQSSTASSEQASAHQGEGATTEGTITASDAALPTHLSTDGETSLHTLYQESTTPVTKRLTLDSESQGQEPGWTTESSTPSYSETVKYSTVTDAAPSHSVDEAAQSSTETSTQLTVATEESSGPPISAVATPAVRQDTSSVTPGQPADVGTEPGDVGSTDEVTSTAGSPASEQTVAGTTELLGSVTEESVSSRSSPSGAQASAAETFSTERYPETTSKPYTSTQAGHEPRTCERGASPCLSGGTCITDGTGFQCKCPLQFEGVHCERPSNMSEVSILPPSWLLFRVLTPAVELIEGAGVSFSHRLEVTMRIVSEEGVVFTLAEAEEGQTPGYHLQMSLYRGRWRLQFSCGLQSVRFSESKQRIDTGHPTKISARLTIWSGNGGPPHAGRCQAELRLNNSLAVSGEQLRPVGAPRRHAAIAHLVFGSWPRGRQSRPQSGLEDEDDGSMAAPGVTACLSNVKVNGWPRLLLADVTAGTSDVIECTQLACLSNPCLHGGTCEESESATWFCHCPTGRLGAQCEKSVCTNSPCEGGGTCLVHPGTNFVCICPFGRQGVFCEQELAVTRPCLAPALVGVLPHLALPLTPRHSSFRHGLELKLRFTAARTHQVAILAYLGHGPKDHMALSYVHGRVMLTWDLGSGPRRVFTTREFIAGVEQEVHIGRSGREAWLKVVGDNGTHSGHSTGKMTQLNTRPVLLIGGFDKGNASLLPHDLPKHSGFEGCVSNIEIKTGSTGQVSRYFPPGPPSNPLRGRGVSQHGVQICASNPCLHRGICLPHGPSFTCLCAQGWFGPVCAESGNPCDTHTSLCAQGSTCVPLVRGYECDCPLGRMGPFCRTAETRSSVVWPEVFFSGRRSYLEVQRRAPGVADPGTPEHSCVEFEMKPGLQPADAAASQVLFFSKDQVTEDYMALILAPDKELQLLLGSGDGSPLVLRSPRGNFVRPGSWVRVRAGRVGRRVFLSVAARPVSSWLLPGQAGDWGGGAAPLYIGGAPDLAAVAPLVWSPVKPFVGCIRRLHVDWRKVLVHLGKTKVAPRETRLSSSPSVFEPAMAQLMPEYLRQVQISENWSSSSLNSDASNIFIHDTLAAFVSGQREYGPNWNPKHSDGIHLLKNKISFAEKTYQMQSKLLTPTEHQVTKRLPRAEATIATTSQEYASTISPTVLSRTLRSRDALFVSAARNVRPCDKSVPAQVQLDPACDGDPAGEGCQSLQYQAQNEQTAASPKFDGNGWLMIRVPAQQGADIETKTGSPFSYLRIRFSASQPNDIIVWAQQDVAEGAFVGVGLKDGRLSIVWGSGNRTKPDTRTAILSSSLADGNFHSVTVLWDCSGEAKEALVWLDGERGEVEQEHERTRRKRQHRAALQTSAQSLTIYLGGFPTPQSVVKSSLGHFKSPLHGCISELSWNDETAVLSEFSSYPHQNVSLCQ